jgi:hypothetical protein
MKLTLGRIVKVRTAGDKATAAIVVEEVEGGVLARMITRDASLDGQEKFLTQEGEGELWASFNGEAQPPAE